MNYKPVSKFWSYDIETRLDSHVVFCDIFILEKCDDAFQKFLENILLIKFVLLFDLKKALNFVYHSRNLFFHERSNDRHNTVQIGGTVYYVNLP